MAVLDCFEDHAPDEDERVSVVSAEGRRLGDVEGFVVDDEGRATHVVVRRSDVLGARASTVPLDAVLRVGVDSITLDLPDDDLRVLPTVPVEPWVLWRRSHEAPTSPAVLPPREPARS